MNLHIIPKDMIVALFVLDVLFPQPIDCFRVPHSKERSRRHLELWVVLLDDIGCGGILQCEIKNSANNMFDVGQEVVKGYKVKLCFDMSEFRELFPGTNVSIQHRTMMCSRKMREMFELRMNDLHGDE